MTELSICKMTSMEISEITGKQHQHVMRDIRDEIERLSNAEVETESKFGLRERDGLTGKIPYYELSKEGVLQLAARYDAVVRAKLIDLAMNKDEPKQLDASTLSPTLQMFNQLFLNAANLEIQQQQLKHEISEVKTTLYLVKDTVANHPEDNWRDTINSMFNKIVKAVGNKEYQKIRSDSYKLLEERAGVNLNIRLENYRVRLTENGSTKSKINSANKLDIVESDKKLREIYTGIIKELTIKHVA
jgi:hypothetical protein